MKCILTIFSSLLFFFQIHAQGWDKTLTDVGSFRIAQHTPTKDGGCMLLGIDSASQKISVLKIDNVGRKQWLKLFPEITAGPPPYQTGLYRTLQDNDGNYWLGVSTPTLTESFILKLDKDGNRLFARNQKLRNVQINTINNQLVIFGIKTTVNESVLLRLNANGDTININSNVDVKLLLGTTYSSAIQNNNLIIFSVIDNSRLYQSVRIGFDGAILSRVQQPPNFNFVVLPITEMIKTSDGGFIIPDSINLFKIDALGNFLWRKPINATNANPYSPPLFRYMLAATGSDGSFLTIRDNVSSRYLELKKYTVDGILQSTSFWPYTGILTNSSLVKTANGGYLIAGQDLRNQVRLVKLDENGYFYPYFIKGDVYGDRDDNCQFSSADIPTPRVFVIGKRTGFPDVTALSDASGRYTLNVDAGTYTVSVVKPNRYMEPCTPSVSKTVNASNPSDFANFPLKASFYCGLMQVDVTTPRLRRCFNNNYTVSYCNTGTAVAVGAYVNVTLDSLLEFVSAARPVISRTGRTYRFNLGDVPMNDCRSFDIVARVRCGDSTRLNQTLCVAAKIYPDTICVPDNSLWSGANLIVSGTCQGDSVLFQVVNAGRAAAPASTSQVIENLSITSLNIGALAVNGTFSKKYPANGNTWRMIVNQVPNHPRSTQPTAFVEGCRRNGTVPFATGFAASFANDDADISLDVDCQPIIGAYDPNDKVGYPLGAGITKAIDQNQDIEYRIRFQNTGTDTAFTVVIRDTIDVANLDIQSIEWGASSHRYTPEIYKENIVKFTFDNILLVDSFTNEPKSNGFVKFRIKQKKDVAFGTKIQNSAGIYFDFNDPILTNKTLHTVSKDIVSATVDKSGTTYPMVKVYPNPASETMTFELTDTPLSISTFELFDMLGKRLVTQQFNGKTFEFQRQSLPTGVYLFKMTTGNAIVGTGKLMIRD